MLPHLNTYQHHVGYKVLVEVEYTSSHFNLNLYVREGNLVFITISFYWLFSCRLCIFLFSLILPIFRPCYYYSLLSEMV